MQAHSKICTKSVPVNILPDVAKETLQIKVMDLEMEDVLDDPGGPSLIT